MVNYLNQAAIILKERTDRKEQKRREDTIAFEVDGEPHSLNICFSSEPERALPTKPCLPCMIQIIRAVAVEGCFHTSATCPRIQPKVSLTRLVISAYDNEPFITNQIFADGDPIYIESREFDLTFYLHYVNRFIHVESDLTTFLKLFDASFYPNPWYQKSNSGYLHRLISDSRWNSAYLKALFGCLQYEDGLTFLESDELNQYGYEPLIKAFKIKYANTSTSIVTDADVAGKLEEWMMRSQFNDYVNQLFEQQIQGYKTRKKTYFDDELKQWREYDGSLEAKKKIFLSQFSRYPEFEAKRRIIQKLIRKAENEVRMEKGFSVVGTLVNESILYSRLKQHFSSYNVISQYRPKWLGRQSLDVFIEDLNVAIEYQGDQHTRPVEFFGGEAAYEKTKQRDQKKLDRCRRYGCQLIYAYPGYNFEDLIQQITSSSKFK